MQPLSFRYDNTNGHTPTIFATTSIRPGVERSFVMTAFRNAGRDAMQSRVSPPLERFITNCVIDTGPGSQSQK